VLCNVFNTSSGNFFFSAEKGCKNLVHTKCGGRIQNEGLVRGEEESPERGRKK